MMEQCLDQKLTPELEASLEEASRVIKQGGVCAFPTETGYGLAASIYHPEAMERIYHIKKRPSHKPLLMLVDHIDEAPILHNKIPDYGKRLMKRFWPGPLTLLLPARSGLSPYLTGDTGKIGVRISSHPVARCLVRLVGEPITATSANLSGKGLTKDIAQVKRQFKRNMPDYLLDGGEIDPGPPSTIVDATGPIPIIVRQGAICLEDILAVCWKGRS